MGAPRGNCNAAKNKSACKSKTGYSSKVKYTAKQRANIKKLGAYQRSQIRNKLYGWGAKLKYIN